MATVRRVIREKAFQTLYLMNAREGISQEEALEQILFNSVELDDESMTESEALKQVLSEKNQSDNIASDALTYLKILIKGVNDEKAVIDEQISKHLDKWTINRIEKTNLIVLRISCYELFFQTDIDPSIVINEAIELTKTFNDEKSSKFVNGVLQSILDSRQNVSVE